MFQKLFLAVIMTLVLNLFLGVRLTTNSQAASSFDHHTPQVTKEIGGISDRNNK